MPSSSPVDTRPIPYLVIPLKCPLCGCILYSEFVQGVGEVHEHKLLAVGAEGCPNEFRRFVVDGDLKVREVLCITLTSAKPT
jgi:hypothetical protein